MKLKVYVSSALVFLATILVLSACKNGNESQSGNEHINSSSPTVSLSENSTEQSSIDSVTYEQDKNLKTSEKNISSEEKQTESLTEGSTEETSSQESSGYIEGSFSTLTKEQDEEIKIWEEKYHGHMPYLRATTCGEVDPDAPKLTRDDINRIIKESEKVQNITAFVKEDWQPEGRTGIALRYDYICEEIRKIQKYPDFVGGSGNTIIEYWLTPWNGKTIADRKVIELIPEGAMVSYVEYEGEYNTTKYDVLCKLAPTDNAFDRENIPTLTRPIDYFKKYI